MTGWESVACPICETREHLKVVYVGVTTWEHPGQFNYYQCSNCGLVLQSPRVVIAKIGAYYPSQSYWGRNINSSSVYPNFQRDRLYHYGPIYKGIFDRKDRGRILDIGAGLGLFLSLFKEKGWEVLGTETSAPIARFAKRAFGIEVLTGELSKLKIPSPKFDVVSFLGVFEHIYNPVQTLQIVKRCLKRGGLLVIIPPNFASLGRLVFGKSWYSLDPGRHVFHYDPTTITKILHKTGFEVEEISHRHWVHNQYSWYINLRYLFSPKFKKSSGGSVLDRSRTPGKKINLMIAVGKAAAWLVSVIMATIEMLVNRGESMMVYARVKN